jgi:hypothetical protein
MSEGGGVVGLIAAILRMVTFFYPELEVKEEN